MIVGISISEVQSSGISFLGTEITNTMVWTWLILILLSALFIWLGSGLKVKPEGKKQVIAEMIYGAIDDMVTSNMGEACKGFIPYFLALFSFLLVSNISGFISLGVVRAPTADIATPAAVAILTFILTQVNKIRTTGVKAYFKSFIEPIPIMLPMNIIGELANPVSLTFRLFGNMMGGMMLGALIYAMLVGSNFIPIWISVAAVLLTVLLLTKQYKKLKTLEKGKKILVMGLAIICMLPLFPMAVVHGYFDVFAGCLQAYIFCMLSMLFIAG